MGAGVGVGVGGRAVAGRARGENVPSSDAGSRQTRHCALWPDLSLRCSPPWQGAPAEVAGAGDAGAGVAGAGAAGVQSPAGPGREVVLDLRGVVRVLPAVAREPSSFAIELWELRGDGARRRHRLEPARWEEAEAWVLALRQLLPSEAFVTPRRGALEWRHFPRPTTDPAYVVHPHHPLSTLGPPEEAAAALVTLCNLRGHRLVAADLGAPRALMHALSESAGAGLIDLDGRALGWSEEMLELVLLALVHSPHLRGLRLRRFALGAACCRAVAALLRHSAVLESLQLSGCALHPGCAGAWAEAIAANQLLPLTVLAVGAGEDHLPAMRPPPPTPPSPRAARAALQANARLGGDNGGDGGGAVLRNALRGARQPLHELHLVGCGLSGGAVAAVCEGLLHHSSRFGELLQLRRLSLPCDGLDTATAAADPLLEVLRRARGLRCLRLIASSPATSAPPPPLPLPPPPAKGARAVPPPPRASLLAHLLGAVTLGGAPLRLLQVEGLAADPTAELALLQLPRSFAHLAHLGLRGTTLGANALCAMVALACHDASRPPLTLECSDSRLGPCGALKLAAAVEGAVALRGLHAARNGFGGAALAALLAALTGQRCLRTLGIGGNLLPGDDVALPPPQPTPPQSEAASAPPPPAAGPVRVLAAADGGAAAGGGAGARGTAGGAAAAMKAVRVLLRHPSGMLTELEFRGNAPAARGGGGGSGSRGVGGGGGGGGVRGGSGGAGGEGGEPGAVHLPWLVRAVASSGLVAADLSGYAAAPLAPAALLAAVRRLLRANTALERLACSRNGWGAAEVRVNLPSCYT